MASHGVTFGKPEIDLDKIRGWKESVIAQLTGGLGGMAKARKVQQYTVTVNSLQIKLLKLKVMTAKNNHYF